MKDKETMRKKLHEVATKYGVSDKELVNDLEPIFDWIEQEAERRGTINERKRLHKEVKDMSMCYDNGIIDNESDDDFIRGQIHNKEHVLKLLEEENER